MTTQTPNDNDETPLLPKTFPTSSSSSSTSELYGLFLMACSSLAFSLMFFLVHVSESLYDFPPLSTMLVRAVVLSVLPPPFIFFSQSIRLQYSSITATKRLMLVFRGFSGSLALVFNFIALSILPVGIAITVYFFSPVFVMILSRLFLKEHILPTDFLAAIISFAGLLLTARPDESILQLSGSKQTRTIGILCALGGAFSDAVTHVSQRSLGRSVHFLYSVFSLGVASLIVCIPYVILANLRDSLLKHAGLSYSILSASFAFAGQSLLNKGLQHCRAGPGTTIRMLDIPLVYFCGLVFLHETVSSTAVLGSILVVSGALLIGLRQFLTNPAQH